MPLFQNESKCANEFCMQFHFHANQSHFHKNSFAIASRLALKQTHKGTRKWPILRRLVQVFTSNRVVVRVVGELMT